MKTVNDQHTARLDAALRDLDPATSHPQVDDRAAALARVLARVETQPGEPREVRVGARNPARRLTPRRMMVLGGAASALAVGSVVAPGLMGGSTPLAWSATPHVPATDDARQAQQACADDVRDGHHPPGTDISGLRPVITEARGSLVMVYLTDAKPAPSELTCYVQDGRVVATGGSLASSTSAPSAAVGPRSLHGALGAVYSTDAGSIRGVTGAVGSDVVGVVLDSVAKGPVTATVSAGHFAAWWPDAPTTEEKENAATAPEITGATVTLRDGSTREVSVEELTGRSTAELARPDTGGSTAE